MNIQELKNNLHIKRGQLLEYNFLEQTEPSDTGLQNSFKRLCRLNFAIGYCDVLLERSQDEHPEKFFCERLIMEKIISYTSYGKCNEKWHIGYSAYLIFCYCWDNNIEMQNKNFLQQFFSHQDFSL